MIFFKTDIANQRNKKTYMPYMVKKQNQIINE